MLGVNECQGRITVRECYGAKSAWVANAIWSREGPHFLGIVYMVNPSYIYYKCGIMLILKCSPCPDFAV